LASTGNRASREVKTERYDRAMVHGIWINGKIERLECNPSDIDEELTRRGAPLAFSATSEEEFQKRLQAERDRSGPRWE
jgi:hypothetical protein